MITFIPHAKLGKSIQALPPNLAVNQIRETRAIISAINNETGWYYSAVGQMWKDYTGMLVYYYNYNIHWAKASGAANVETPMLIMDENPPKPHWLTDFRLHATHQSNLQRKRPDHFSYEVQTNLEYYWPNRKYWIEEDSWINTLEFRPYLDLIREANKRGDVARARYISNYAQQQNIVPPIAFDMDTIRRWLYKLYLVVHPGQSIDLGVKNCE